MEKYFFSYLWIPSASCGLIRSHCIPKLNFMQCYGKEIKQLIPQNKQLHFPTLLEVGTNWEIFESVGICNDLKTLNQLKVVAASRKNLVKSIILGHYLRPIKLWTQISYVRNCSRIIYCAVTMKYTREDTLVLMCKIVPKIIPKL